MWVTVAVVGMLRCSETFRLDSWQSKVRGGASHSLSARNRAVAQVPPILLLMLVWDEEFQRWTEFRSDDDPAMVDQKTRPMPCHVLGQYVRTGNVPWPHL